MHASKVTCLKAVRLTLNVMQANKFFWIQYIAVCQSVTMVHYIYGYHSRVHSIVLLVYCLCTSVLIAPPSQAPIPPHPHTTSHSLIPLSVILSVRY